MKYVYNFIFFKLFVLSLQAQPFTENFDLVWKKEGDKTGLADRHTDTTLIPVEYKEIGCDNNFCFAFDGTFYTLFPLQTFKKLSISNIRDVVQRVRFSNYYHILIGNELKWIDKNGNFIDSLPAEQFDLRVCGTVEHCNRRIEVKTDSLLLITSTGYPGDEYDKIDTINIRKYFKKTSLKFLNNNNAFNYNENTNLYKGISPHFFFQFKKGKK